MNTHPLTALDLGKFTLQLDTTHHYRPRWSGYNAQCRVRLWRNEPGEHIVMFTELQANQGISITNYSENLATEIRQLFGLDIDTTYWIEHYPPNPLRQQTGIQKEFDQITYTWDLRTLTADDPEWHRLDPAALQPLFVEPAPNVTQPTAQDWNRAQWLRLRQDSPILATQLYDHIMANGTIDQFLASHQRAAQNFWDERQIRCAYAHLVKLMNQQLPPREIG